MGHESLGRDSLTVEFLCMSCRFSSYNYGVIFVWTKMKDCRLYFAQLKFRLCITAQPSRIQIKFIYIQGCLHPLFQ